MCLVDLLEVAFQLRWMLTTVATEGTFICSFSNALSLAPCFDVPLKINFSQISAFTF